MMVNLRVKGEVQQLVACSLRKKKSMHRILIVDDEVSIRFAMSDYFNMQGYLVDCAQSIEEAEALLGSASYSVVIADLRLAGMGDLGGLEVVKSVRERSSEIPIIVLSAYHNPEIEAEMERHKVNVFLRKPKPLPYVAQIVLGSIVVGCNSPQPPTPPDKNCRTE